MLVSFNSLRKNTLEKTSNCTIHRGRNRVPILLEEEIEKPSSPGALSVPN